MSQSTADERDAALDVARRGREAAVALRTLTRDRKDSALLAIADALDAATDRVVSANADDEPRSSAALPLLSARTAASTVTLGRAS